MLGGKNLSFNQLLHICGYLELYITSKCSKRNSRSQCHACTVLLRARHVYPGSNPEPLKKNPKFTSKNPESSNRNLGSEILMDYLTFIKEDHSSIFKNCHFT